MQIEFFCNFILLTPEICIFTVFFYFFRSVITLLPTFKLSFNVTGILKEWQENLMVEGYTSSNHSLCNQEYSQLLKEFDAYKQQMAVAAASSTAAANSCASDEFEPLKTQISGLKDRVSLLTNELEQTHADHKLLLEEQRCVSTNRKQYFYLVYYCINIF